MTGMAAGLSLDHIILPKDVTDGFYSTWHNYYGELFPSPVKPKYRPMSKIFSSNADVITQSSPNLLFDKMDGPVKDQSSIDFSLPLGQSMRVGDNIDEFIRNNRKKMFRSNSLNDLISDFEDQNIIEVVNKNTAKQDNQPDENVRLRSKSDLTQDSMRKSNRFSWCGSQTIKFLSNFQNKKKTYDCLNVQNKLQ